MRRWMFHLLLYGTLFALTGNCIDPILFPITDTTNGLLVVSGQITDLDEPHFVFLSRSSVNNEEPIPVRLAKVELIAGDVSYTLQEDMQKAGRYRLDGFIGTPGESYQLKIKTGNQAYESSIETMPLVIGTDSLFYEITEESFISADMTRLTHKLNVFAKSKMPTEGNYYWRWDPWEFYFLDLTNFPDPFNTLPPDCFASDRIDKQRINLVDGSVYKEATLQQQIASREIDYTFKNRHYIISRQLSTTRSSFEYWSKVKTLLANSGSPFDIPPAPIRGNIKRVGDDNELVLGFFDVCRARESRFFLVQGYIPYPIEPYCEYNPLRPNDNPPVCLDCSLSPNATSERPSWF